MDRLARLVPPLPAPCIGGCGQLIVGNVCAECAARIEAAEEVSAHREAIALVRARIPTHAAESRFNSPLLTEHVEERARAAAVKVLGAANTAGWPPFIVLLGDPGSGKTLLAAAMLNAVLDRSCQIGASPERRAFARRAWWSEAQLPARARAEYPLGRGEPPEITKCESASLLVLDDVGAETARSSGVPDLVKLRAARGRPTIVTTRLGAPGIAQRYRDTDGDGVARRLFESGRAVVLPL